jgi:hypothetical protein
MKLKKIFGLLLVLAMLGAVALSLSACGKKVEVDDIELPKQTAANLAFNYYDTENLNKKSLSEFDVSKYFLDEDDLDNLPSEDLSRYVRYLVAGKKNNERILVFYCKNDESADTIYNSLKAIKDENDDYKKYVLDKGCRDLSIDSDTTLLHNTDVARLLEDDESTHLLGSHLHTRLNDRVKFGILLVATVAEVEDARQPLEALTLTANDLQEVANLGLEDDEDSDDTHRDNLTQNCREEHQVEGLDKNPHKVDNEDTHNDVWRRCSAHSTVYTIEQRRHQYNFYNINKCKWYESHPAYDF